MIELNVSDVRENLNLFLEHYQNFSSDDLYFRFFFTTGPEGIRNWLMDLDDKKYDHRFFIEEENDQYLGIVHLTIDRTRKDCEVAVSVIPSARNKGIASNLIENAIEYADDQFMNSVTFQCKSNNHNCRDMFKKLGFNIHYNHDEECMTGRLYLGDI